MNILNKIKLTPTQNKVLVVTILGIVVILVGIIVWMQGTTDVDDGKDKSSDVMLSVNEARSKALRIIADGDIDRGMKYYDEQISLMDNKEDKQQLLMMKAKSAQRMERYDISVDAAQRADDIGSSNMTIRALADAYAARGDKEQAIDYYKKLLAAESAPPEGGVVMRFGPSVEDIIKELEQ